jgi:tRNA(Arg) A34 adenosine deaminase TadA
MATAFTMLRKLHATDARDGVVALIVERNGRIVSWGRKNPEVPCWHGETSAIMGLKGRIPPGSTVYSTLKPCKMCAGMIQDASGGDAKVFWGQDDPGSLAADTALDISRKGMLMDGNKTQVGARAILLQDRDVKTPMSQKLGSSFQAQKGRGEKSTIDYIVTPEAATIVKQAEAFLKAKHTKYGVEAPEHFNENTAFVVRYLMTFLQQLGLQPESLGV